MISPPGYNPLVPCCFKLTERLVHYHNVLCLKISKALMNSVWTSVEKTSVEKTSVKLKPSGHIFYSGPSKCLTKLYKPRAYKWDFMVLFVLYATYKKYRLFIKVKLIEKSWIAKK